MAKGAFPELHPLCARTARHARLLHANYALNQADLLIAFGARFDDRVTGKLDAFAPGAMIHVDIDPAEINKNRDGRRADRRRRCAHVLPKLAEALHRDQRRPAAGTREWRSRSRAGSASIPFTLPQRAERAQAAVRDRAAVRDDRAASE